MNEVYVVLFKYNGRTKYCLWYTDEMGDDRLLKCSHSLKLFETTEDVIAYCHKNNLKISDEPVLEFNLNSIIFVKENTFSANQILNFWNMVADVSKTLDIVFQGSSLGPEINNIYDKLFLSSDIPTLRGDHPQYSPIWSNVEKELLVNIINEGLIIIKNAIFIE